MLINAATPIALFKKCADALVTINLKPYYWWTSKQKNPKLFIDLSPTLASLFLRDPFSELNVICCALMEI
jgi:hypothetical protein